MFRLFTHWLTGARYRRTRFYTAFFLYAMILVLGSVPHARAEIGEVASGLVLHSVAYAVITFLLASGSARSHRGRAIQAILIVVVMGAIDESVQSFFPYRTAAVNDWLVDCAAALVTAGIYFGFSRKSAMKFQ